jgi:hypothetical protein
MSQTTSLELENSFRNMLLMHGLQPSSPVFHTFTATKTRLEQIHIGDWQMQWQQILLLMEKTWANVTFFPLPFLAVLDP